MRPLLSALLAGLLLSALPLAAAAQSPEAAPPDSGVAQLRAERLAAAPPASRNARLAMSASLVFPGLGQLYNDEGWRSLVVFGWEAYYLSVILREGQRADLYKRRAAALGEGETWRGLDSAALRERFHAHEKRQTDYVWYTGALVLASVLDAYVFANLHGFETDDIRGRRAAVLPSLDLGAQGVGLQLRVSF
ncbi:hypothetical protein FJ251_05970 [bacterium]|nr:hypothetical protein [bacterium]